MALRAVRQFRAPSKKEWRIVCEETGEHGISTSGASVGFFRCPQRLMEPSETRVCGSWSCVDGGG